MGSKHSYGNEKKYIVMTELLLYELQLPKPPNLPNPFEIYSIYRDRKGNIWFGSNLLEYVDIMENRLNG